MYVTKVKSDKSKECNESKQIFSANMSMPKDQSDSLCQTYYSDKLTLNGFYLQSIEWNPASVQQIKFAAPSSKSALKGSWRAHVGLRVTRAPKFACLLCPLCTRASSSIASQHFYPALSSSRHAGVSGHAPPARCQNERSTFGVASEFIPSYILLAFISDRKKSQRVWVDSVLWWNKYVLIYSWWMCVVVHSLTFGQIPFRMWAWGASVCLQSKVMSAFHPKLAWIRSSPSPRSWTQETNERLCVPYFIAMLLTCIAVLILFIWNLTTFT